MKKKFTADQYRIMGDNFNWMICKPLFNKDGGPKLNKKTGEQIYEAFKFYPRLEMCITRWAEFLMAEGFEEKAGDVDDIHEHLTEVQNRVEAVLRSVYAPITP